MTELLQPGDIVMMRVPSGECAGQVIEAHTVDQMPDLGPGSFEAIAIMKELRVDYVALVCYWGGAGDVNLFALHCPDGWRDLQGQHLVLAKVREASTEGAA